MKTTYLLGTIGVVGSLGALVAFGCSSSSSGGSPSTGDDAGGADSGSSSGGSSSGASSGGSSSGSGSSSGGTDAASDAPALSCDTYCTTILANCTAADGGIGGNAQYYDMTDCKNTCALFPAGAYGDSINSLGCRQYHATLAATGPAVHCPHAGAGGGGLCGTRCDDYCTLVMAHCTTANGAAPPYGSLADCTSACNAYPYQADAADYDPDLIGTLNCLDYHLRESLSDLAGQGIDGGHCDDLSIDGGTTRGACHP